MISKASVLLRPTCANSLGTMGWTPVRIGCGRAFLLAPPIDFLRSLRVPSGAPQGEPAISRYLYGDQR